MKLKRKAFSSLAVDIPALDVDQEGKLRGGFTMVKGRNGVATLGGNLNCDCNCDCGSGKNYNCNCDCDCGTSADRNCNCNCSCNSTPESSSPKSGGLGMNFLMF